MKYRVIQNETALGNVNYQPQYFDEAHGWKTAYTSGYESTTYKTLDEAKEACVAHAQNQPKVVWTENL